MTLNPVSTRGSEVSDTFTRPANATQYAVGDVIAATTSDTATTPLRKLEKLAPAPGKLCWLVYARLDTNLPTFIGTVRVHLYKVAQPTTALAGDNAALVLAYNSVAQRIASFDLPELALVHDDDNYVSAEAVGLRIPIVSAAYDRDIYYRLELIDAEPTPGSGQSFTLTCRVSDN